jgi:uroporphyrinogen-III synthase
MITPHHSALYGARVLITRPLSQAESLAAELRRRGAHPVYFPTISIAANQSLGPLAEALGQLASYHWVIFTSANGVQAVAEGAAAFGLTNLIWPPIAVIGPATGHAVQMLLGQAPSLLPSAYVAESLLAALLSGGVAGQRYLLLRAAGARPLLADGLRGQGGWVREIAVYAAVTAQPTPDQFADLEAGVQFITFTSPSTVQGFCALLGEKAYQLAEKARVICIGPVTAAAAQQAGFTVAAQASEYTIAGLLAALEISG